MKTSELIKQARECVGNECTLCSFVLNCNGIEKLIVDLADRLEMEMKTSGSYWEEIGEWTKLATQLENALDKACKALETNSTRGDVDSCWECPRKNDCFNCSAEQWKEWLLRDAED